MSKFNDWATADSEGDEEEQPIVVAKAPPRAPPPPPPPPVEPGQLRPTAVPGVLRVQIADYGVRQQPLVSLPRVDSTCGIVKGGQPEWDSKMAQLPDLAAAAGIEAPAVDAVRDLVSIPEQAAMSHWTKSSRYKNGLTDQTAKGTLEGHVGSHGDSVGSIRSSKATPKGTGPQNL